MKQPYTNVLITGASSGLGRGLALWFAKHGAKVYAVDRMARSIVRGDAEFLRVGNF